MHSTDLKIEIKSGVILLREVIRDLILFYQQDLDYSKMIYTYWNAKDILGHLTFWHESFARNVKDVSMGVKPNPIKGKLSEVNAWSVGSTHDIPIQDLVDRLLVAQETIEQHIINPSIQKIPYKKGSRDYSRLEHLDIVERHIKKHLRDLEKKYKNGQTKK